MDVMSKWYKVIIRDQVRVHSNFDSSKMLEFFGKDNSRRKVTRRRIAIIRINGLASYPYEYCFKFKDKTDAMAFKLRWK